MQQRLQKIRNALSGCRLGHPLLILKETASTNDVVKAQAQKGAPEGLVVAAESQTRGRGRNSRSWLSLPGKGVYMSVLLRPNWPAIDGVFLNICAAVAVARALEKLVRPVRLKWPNDILIHGRKVGGVLVEPRLRRSLIEFAVVGIGINVQHRRAELASLGEGLATSLRLAGARADCDRVLTRVLNELEFCYALAQREDKSRLLREWAARQYRR